MKTNLIVSTIMLVLIMTAAPLFAQEVIDLTDDTSEVKTVTIRNEGLSFDPPEIRVRKGDTLQITFEVTAGGHDWTIDEFDTGTDILGAEESETIEFTADEAGTFEYYCSVGTHRERGMVGTLVVVEE